MPVTCGPGSPLACGAVRPDQRGLGSGYTLPPRSARAHGGMLRRHHHLMKPSRFGIRLLSADIEKKGGPMPWNEMETYWMKRAIALAREGEAEPGKNPIGCVIVRDGQAIGEACNEVDLRHDATAHAEILAIGRAGARVKCNELTNAVLYTT